jgi:catechol 2,3-dioxygenase-like lactoylglutathione lyase family enzyme
MNAQTFSEKTAAVNAVKAVTLGVPNLAACAEFYEKVWGLTRAAQAGVTIYLRGSGDKAFILALEERPRAELLELELGAPDRDMIEKLRTQVAACGAKILSARETPDTAGDPGFAFEGLGLRRVTVKPLRFFRGGDVASREGPKRISHVVLNTDRRDEAARFCQSALGFGLSDHTRMMHFLRCNADHHSLALADGPRPSLNHVAYEMGSLDLLMRCAARVQAAGFPLEWGVGRHGPGDNIFAYFLDPAGFICEYTTGMEQVRGGRPVGSPEDWDRFWKDLGKAGDRWGLAPPMSQRIANAFRGE